MRLKAARHGRVELRRGGARQVYVLRFRYQETRGMECSDEDYRLYILPRWDKEDGYVW